MTRTRERRRFSLALAFAVLAAAPAASSAQEYRTSLPAPAKDIFGSLLDSASKGDFARAARNMAILHGLGEGVSQSLGEDAIGPVSAAIAAKDGAALKSAALRFQILDIRDQVKIASNAKNSDTAKGMVSVAYAEYQNVGPTLPDDKFAADKEVRKLFQNLNQAASTAQFEVASSANTLQFRSFAAELDKRLAGLLVSSAKR